MATGVSELDPQYTAIVVAAGQGARSGQSVPKQFADVAGKPMLRWSVERFASDPRCVAVCVVIGDGQQSDAEQALAGIERVEYTIGGATRQQSVASGLRRIAASPANAALHVMIHDAARPFLSLEVIDRLLTALENTEAAVPVLPVADTMVEAYDGDTIGDVVPRETLRRVQTPQAFHMDAILAAHDAADDEEASDDAQLLRRQGKRVAAVMGSRDLEKLTFSEDFTLAQFKHDAPRRVAMGMGYDVHRLVPDKPLWIGGLQIAHSHGLSGHSDADVALHALTDAILGALAEGDIGQHFPPSDAKWKGASSDKFLAFAGERIAARAGEVQSLDLTIICEAPKIGPHREAMRHRIAEILQLPVDIVSVKATTTEGLGFTGRREGIAAQAIASISLPHI